MLLLLNCVNWQGDREVELGLPISPLCDRQSTLVAESQIGKLTPWLRVKENYFQVILKSFQCYILHATTSETEITLFQPLTEMWNDFRIISSTLNMLENIREQQ